MQHCSDAQEAWPPTVTARVRGVELSENRSEALTAWAQDFGKMASQDALVDSFTERVDAVITKQIPEIANDPILVQDLHRSTRAEWREFVESLREDHRLVRPGQGADLARSLARRGLDLGILLKVYRVSQQSVFQFLTEIIDGASEDAPARDEILVFLWGLGGQWMADAVESLIETYYEERQRLRDDAAVRRAETIEALLGDAPPSADDATRLLDHPCRTGRRPTSSGRPRPARRRPRPCWTSRMPSPRRSAPHDH